MKKFVFVFALVAATGCGSSTKNSNLNSEDDNSVAKVEGSLSAEDIDSSKVPNLDPSLGLTKKGGSHDCTCTIKGKTFALGSCKKKLPLYCADSKNSSGIIASQLIGAGQSKIWMSK